MPTTHPSADRTALSQQVFQELNLPQASMHLGASDLVARHSVFHIVLLEGYLQGLFQIGTSFLAEIGISFHSAFVFKLVDQYFVLPLWLGGFSFADNRRFRSLVDLCPPNLYNFMSVAQRRLQDGLQHHRPIGLTGHTWFFGGFGGNEDFELAQLCVTLSHSQVQEKLDLCFEHNPIKVSMTVVAACIHLPKVVHVLGLHELHS
mmetsp:Transcript_31816/g.59307  ORF Transcript_31816/g.59307 Transcript_31816/m.59307 type:complete len:204 (+) Transcript_31816:168-779(+)